jgi:hypothetical protein
MIDSSLVTTTHASSHQSERELDSFKVLYARAKWCNWQILPGDLLQLARFSKHVNLPGFAETAIATYLDESLYTEERAWACALQGERLEAQEKCAEASSWYERSLAEHPGYKSAYRLCRSRFKERNWSACLEAFQVGLENDEFVHVVDDGNEDKNKALVLIVAALKELGQLVEAKDKANILRAIYPNNGHIQQLCESL